MLKTKVLLSVAALVPGLFLMQSTGSASIAVVDFDRVVADMPEGQDAINKLTAFGTERRNAIDDKLQQAEEIANQLRTQDRVLSEDARNQLTNNLQATQTEIETMQEDAQNKLNQMRQELLSPVETKAATAVAAYATERGVKIVLDASILRDGLVYVHDTADITTEIVRRIAADVRKSNTPYALNIPREQTEDLLARSFNRKWFTTDFLKKESPGPSQTD